MQSKNLSFPVLFIRSHKLHLIAYTTYVGRTDYTGLNISGPVIAAIVISVTIVLLCATLIPLAIYCHIKKRNRQNANTLPVAYVPGNSYFLFTIFQHMILHDYFNTWY